jgi:hypothetical protein
MGHVFFSVRIWVQIVLAFSMLPFGTVAKIECTLFCVLWSLLKGSLTLDFRVHVFFIRKWFQ